MFINTTHVHGKLKINKTLLTERVAVGMTEIAINTDHGQAMYEYLTTDDVAKWIGAVCHDSTFIVDMLHSIPAPMPKS
jgi:hypothetical protein